MGFFQEARQLAHEIDPVGASLVDFVVKTDSTIGREVGRIVRDSPGGERLGRNMMDEAQKNIDDPARAMGRAAATIALLYGAYAGWGAMGGGGAAGGTAGGGAAAGGAAGGATGATASGGFWSGAAQAGGSALAANLLSPKPKEPKTTAPSPMPDPQAQEEARKRQIMAQMARRGRAASILTSPTGTLG